MTDQQDETGIDARDARGLTGILGRSRGSRRRFGLSIQSKLLMMLLGVSVLASVVVGAVGYVNAREALRQSALDQLVSVRELRSAEVERAMDNVQQAAVLGSRNQSAVEASAAFNAAFKELETSTLDPAQTAELDAYYTDTFVPDLEDRSGVEFDADSFIPTDPAARYLQDRYMVPYTDYDKALANMDAGDGSAWSAVHATYHDYFKGMVDQLGYEDILLLDTEGDVVYSAYKGPELGTNVLTGPYKESALSTAFTDVLKTSTVDATLTTDFDRYLPSLNVPTAWVVSPVGEGGEITGVLAFQFPIDTLNNVMTGGESWQGLGQTGETYLAGSDETMRSTSRRLIQDPAAYARKVVADGTPPEIADRAVEVGGTVLLQPVANEAVENALRGETGTMIGPNYIGGENLVAYAPLEIENGPQWVIVARIESAEAFAPVNDFTRNLILSTTAIVLFVSLLSLVLAQVFLRPLKRLLAAVRRVAAGELGVQVDTRSNDEIANLGTAFNDMSRSLQIKQDLLAEEQAENERMLLSLMPEAVAKRYRQGDETIAEDHQDVTVLFADILGFDDFSTDLESEQALAMLNDIVRGFDEAADRLGVERVRSTKLEGYLASCGLIVPRVDNARRTVECAIELQEVLERFNVRNGASLRLRAGIDSGTVTSGLVGRTSVVYDMWGDAVNLAHRVQATSPEPGIYLTQRVVDKLPDTIAYSESGTLTTQSGEQRVWRIDLERTSV